MMTRVLVNGAQGKMGQEVCKAITAHPALELVATAGRQDDLALAIRKNQAEIVIDFTVPSVVYQNTKTIIEADAHPIIGTTGLLPEQIREFQQLCADKKLGGIIAPNFSIGAVLMMRYAEDAARYYSQVEIIEMHHAGKEDSPSGTALKTAEMIRHANQDMTTPRKGRETIPGARGALHDNIPIHAIRLSGLVACQEVIFGGTGETLTIRHHSIHRESFMPGICLACQKVVKLQNLVYGLEGIL